MHLNLQAGRIISFFQAMVLWDQFITVHTSKPSCIRVGIRFIKQYKNVSIIDLNYNNLQGEAEELSHAQGPSSYF